MGHRSWITSVDFARPTAMGDLAHELERRLEQQAAVARLAQHALEGASLDALLEEIIHVVGAQLGCDVVGYIECGDEPGTICLTAGSGWPERLAHDGRIVPMEPGGLAEQVLSSRAPMILSDAGQSPPSPILREAGISSSLLVPIHGDRPIGILAAHDHRSRQYTESDATFLMAAGNVVAVAKARLDAEARVHHRALHDALTGLPNRVLLFDRLETLLARARRAGQGAAVLLIDLDRFKLVNDSLGHTVGDALLRAVAARLAGCVRAADTVARLGGDEFAVIVEDAHDVEQAEVVANKILADFTRPVLCGPVEMPVDMSIGVAFTEDCTLDATELLRRADVAMYRAKRVRAGLERYEIGFEDARLRLDLVAEARGAIDADQLQLVYQPQIDLLDGQVLGVEALLRWNHPDLGLLMPADFLPPLETTSAILRFSSWVVDAAIAQAADWHGRGIDLPVAFNVSPSYLQNPGIVHDIAQALERHDLPAGQLTIEVTEQALFTDAEMALETVHQLVTAGVRLSLDDYGTGYSSLGHLDMLPVSELKIDRTFVAGLRAGATDLQAFRRRVIVHTLTRLGAELGLQVVAEGVEDEASIAALREIGCPVAQGFVYSEGTDAATVESLWRHGGFDVRSGQSAVSNTPGHG